MLTAVAAASPEPLPVMLNSVGPTCPTAPIAMTGLFVPLVRVNVATPAAKPGGITKLTCPGDTYSIEALPESPAASCTVMVTSASEDGSGREEACSVLDARLAP